MQKQLELPDALVNQLGTEWAGTYTVRLLMAKEYLATAEQVIQELRSEANSKGETWTGILPQTMLHRAVVYAACRKDGEVLPDDIPSKLFELLASVAVPMNTLSEAEQRNLLSCFR